MGLDGQRRGAIDGLAEERIIGRVLTILAAVLGSAALAPASARETFDIATFEPPPGWQRVVGDGLALFRAPAGDGQLAMFPSTPSTASPADNFTADWQRLVTGALGPIDAPQMATQETPDGWTAVVGATSVLRNGGALAVIQVTTTGFGRTMSVVANLAEGRYVAEITRFFETLEFRAEPRAGAEPQTTRAQPAVPPARAPSGTSGSVIGPPIARAGFENGLPVGMFYRVRVGMTSGARVELETRVFLSGSRISRTLPLNGAATFDASRCLPDTCGSFRPEAGAISVTWDSGSGDRWSYARSGDEIVLEGDEFRPARALPAAALVGEWSGAQSVGNASSNVLRFERDGTFSFGTGGSGGVRGRYRLQDLALTLDYTDSSTKRSTIFAVGRSEPIGMITLDGDVYSRR